MRILAITSEAVPYAKTGGLADAMGALARQLHDNGHDIRMFLPCYDRVDLRSYTWRTVLERLPISLGAHRYHVRILQDVDRPYAYLVDCPALYHRGGIYTQDDDEHRRFLALSVAALTACQYMGFAPEIVQCNDWQAAMVPLLLRVRFGWDRLFANARTLLTIHNLGYQGGFSSKVLPDLEIGGAEHLLHQDLLRQGRINFLLHGILYADAVSTVSPTYAREIQTPEHGVGLDGYLRARSSTVVGILNGVDHQEWSPDADPLIPHAYTADDLDGKERNKQALLEGLGLPYVPGVPLFGVVSRMAWQKGLELVAEVMPSVLGTRKAQLVMLGSGERRLQEAFLQMQQRHPRLMVYHCGFSNQLAHRIEAGADMFLMPSRYEPCGLNQLYSLRYGTVPVVHRTGGLADTVEQWNPRTRTGTGIVFAHHDAAGLRWAVQTAMATYEDRDAWQTLVRNGMSRDFSWETQTRVYEQLFARMRG